MALQAVGVGDSPTGFEGFGEEDRGSVEELRCRMQEKRISDLEETVANLKAILETVGHEVASLRAERGGEMKEIGVLREEISGMKEGQNSVMGELKGAKEEMILLKEENEKLKAENKNLKDRVENEMKCVKKRNVEVSESVQNIQKKQEEWLKDNGRKEESLMKIMEDQREEQRREREKGMRETVIRVIKGEKRVVRDAVDKVKCVVAFGVEEAKIVSREDREKAEKKKIESILKEVTEDAGSARGLIEEFHRIGKFEEGKNRPLKIKFATQAQAEEVLSSSWKLAGKEELKKIWIGRDLDEEERKQLRELVEEAKQKNGERTEEEKVTFYWKAKDLRLRKIYIKK